MAKRKQRKHSAELKFKLVVEALKGERSRAEIAREHDLTKSLLYKWEQQFLANGVTVFQTEVACREAIDERDGRISELERLVGQMTMENHILKTRVAKLASEKTECKVEVMARKRKQPTPTRHEELTCTQTTCIECGRYMRHDYANERTVATMSEVVHLTLRIRRCPNKLCSRYRKVYRPESEGTWALRQHEYGLDVVAEVGRLRYQEKRTVPEMHQKLTGGGVVISERSVTNLLDRYDELISVSVGTSERFQEKLKEQGCVLVGIDGLQPRKGNEVLWVVRDCLSGEILLARSLLSSTAADIGTLLVEVAEQLPVPVVGVVSDGEQALRKAIERTWPDVPYQLCHYHYLKEALKPLSDADRHAKKELKKTVQGIRPIERKVAEQREENDPWADIITEYCLAVRSALTTPSQPPLGAGGLRLHDALTLILSSLKKR